MKEADFESNPSISEIYMRNHEKKKAVACFCAVVCCGVCSCRLSEGSGQWIAFKRTGKEGSELSEYNCRL